MAFGLAGLSLTACSEPEGLRIGEVELPYRQIRALEESLHQAFSSEGRATLLWLMLDGGLAEEALLHAGLPEASTAARAEAELWAGRLRAGESFDALLAELRARAPEQVPDAGLERPAPAHLGGSVAAHVAALEEGAWKGPVRTEHGWELLHLAVREPGPRSIAQVMVERLRFPVGTASDRARARADWARLPLSGNSELLDALPLEFRRGRVRSSAPTE